MVPVEGRVERDQGADEIEGKGRPLRQQVQAGVHRRRGQPRAGGETPRGEPERNHREEARVHPPAALQPPEVLAGGEEVVEEEQQERQGRGLFLGRKGQEEESHRADQPAGRGPGEDAGGHPQAREREEGDEGARAARHVGDRLGGHGARGEQARAEKRLGLRVGPPPALRHPEEERREKGRVRRVDEDVHEVVVPGSGAAYRVVEGPGEVQERARRLVAQDGADGAEVAYGGVAEDQLPVVVEEAAGNGGKVDGERHQGRRERGVPEPERRRGGRARRFAERRRSALSLAGSRHAGRRISS